MTGQIIITTIGLLAIIYGLFLLNRHNTDIVNKSDTKLAKWPQFRETSSTFSYRNYWFAILKKPKTPKRT
jgi:hypothetical protein